MRDLNVLVLSDTHMPARARAFPSPLVEALQRADLILHAGDLADLAILDALKQYAPLHAVSGNVDTPEVRAVLPRRLVVPIGRFQVGLVHGDGEPGSTIARARTAFALDPVDGVVFGHSHQPCTEWLDGRLFLNPGSPTDKRKQPKPSFAWLHVGDTLVPELVYF